MESNVTTAGWYLDASKVYHGSARTRDGSIITIDAPGAGTDAFQGTLPQSISPAGTIAGYYIDASNVSHAFVRASDGAITGFDAPGAGTGSGQGTFLNTINPPGAIVGFYVDSSLNRVLPTGCLPFIPF